MSLMLRVLSSGKVPAVSTVGICTMGWGNEGAYCAWSEDGVGMSAGRTPLL